MNTSISRQTGYGEALLRHSLRTLFANRRQVLTMSATMLVQNSLFFCIWLGFFSTVPQVRGWGLRDVEILVGILAAGVGLGTMVTDGARSIAQRVGDGDLDAFLTQPRHPLPLLLFSGSSRSACGDIVYGLCLLTLAHLDFTEWLLGLAAIAGVAALFLAVIVIFQCLAFFIGGASRLAEQLFIMMICLGSIPQHTQGVAMKIVLFSVLPAGFMAIVPVEALRQHSVGLIALLAGAALFYWLVALRVFRLGLRRYTSALAWRM